MGCESRRVRTIAELRDGFAWARTTDRTTVIAHPELPVGGPRQRRGSRIESCCGVSPVSRPPSAVTRPYMPNPRDIFGAISANLQAAGIKVEAVTKDWNGGYLDDVDEARADLFLLGWTGDYNTPDNFINTFFGNPENRFQTKFSPWGQELADQLKAADSEPDAAKRNKMYEDINADIMEKYLPAIPISHSPPWPMSLYAPGSSRTPDRWSAI